jgi:hypothetical protein
MAFTNRTIRGGGTCLLLTCGMEYETNSVFFSVRDLVIICTISCTTVPFKTLLFGGEI